LARGVLPRNNLTNMANLREPTNLITRPEIRCAKKVKQQITLEKTKESPEKTKQAEMNGDLPAARKSAGRP